MSGPLATIQTALRSERLAAPAAIVAAFAAATPQPWATKGEKWRRSTTTDKLWSRGNGLSLSASTTGVTERPLKGLGNPRSRPSYARQELICLVCLDSRI
jgi:hypothetical protein